MSKAGPGLADRPVEREFSIELQEKLVRYPGKWVAISDSDVVAVADDPVSVLDQARSSGAEEPTLHHVPEDTSKAYFF